MAELPPVGQSCSNCAYYDENNKECRRHPPTNRGTHDKDEWPKVKESDWCGDWNNALPL